MTTVVSSKGQVVLPAQLREQDRIHPGQHFDIQRVEEGEYLLKRKVSENEGLVDWLLSCPDKGWFTEVESESTEML